MAGAVGAAGGGLFSLASGAMLGIAVVTKLPVRGAAGEPGLMPLLYSDARILPAFFLFMGLLALASGIGLMRRRLLGRSLALAFCLIACAWFVFVVVHFWLLALSHTRPLFFRIGPAVIGTPVALLIVAALAFFYRLLRANPSDFS